MNIVDKPLKISLAPRLFSHYFKKKLFFSFNRREILLLRFWYLVELWATFQNEISTVWLKPSAVLFVLQEKIGIYKWNVGKHCWKRDAGTISVFWNSQNVTYFSWIIRKSLLWERVMASFGSVYVFVFAFNLALIFQSLLVSLFSCRLWDNPGLQWYRGWDSSSQKQLSKTS